MRDPDPIQWSDAMLTGIPEIDRQHHILVNTINEAQDKLSGDPDDPLLEQITRDLLAYAIYHFNTEEQLMKQYGYAADAPEEARAHLAAHRGFSEQVVALRNKVLEKKPGARDALLDFLKSWLTNHIMNTDKLLGNFLLSRNVKPAPGK